MSAFSRPFFISAALCLGILALLVYVSMSVCGGHFGYPLDDTYIHMAMAKNFALHGVWGVTRYGFSSATSSPLYTLLLAGAYWVAGVREATPLALNIVALLSVLWFSDWLLRERAVNARARTAVLFALIVAVPLPTLTHVSMEHVFHTLLTLVVIHLLARELAREQPHRVPALALAAVVVLVATRYEGVFVVAVAGLLFLLRKRPIDAVALGIAGALPIAIYGIVSIAHGWYAIPNSLLLKANVPTGESSKLMGTFSHTLLANLGYGAHIVALIAALVFALLARRWNFSYTQVFVTLTAATAALHLVFARIGWFYRYESYLVAAGVLAIALVFREVGWPRRNRLGILMWSALAVFAALIAYRTEHALRRDPIAVSDIYRQQYQMGLFARDYLGTRGLVINDIGAVSFLSDTRVLDLIGLGSLEPVTARLRHEYSPAWLARWSESEGATVAITYPWFTVPSWIKVAAWSIPGNYMSASDTVVIHARSAQDAALLRDALDKFRPRLPARVEVK